MNTKFVLPAVLALFAVAPFFMWAAQESEDHTMVCTVTEVGKVHVGKYAAWCPVTTTDCGHLQITQTRLSIRPQTEADTVAAIGSGGVLQLTVRGTNIVKAAPAHP